jgi:uncharacterized protein
LTWNPAVKTARLNMRHLEAPGLMYLHALMSSETYHEPIELLSEETRNMHRAIVSLKEELEAVDWYQQRAEACSDAELREVLVHNKNEEIEHAMMNLEWIRRHSEVFDGHIKTYINAKGGILAAEKAQTAGEGGASKSSSTSGASGLGIGSLKGAK